MAPRLKHRTSIRHNYLAGITAGDWWRLLRENRFAVDRAYWRRTAFITATSFVNSFYRWRENRRYDQVVRETPITDPPLFILGHWRSGTTWLHYLLAQDDAQFAFANTYQVVNPHTFLTTEEVNSRRFAWLVPATRPMDNMELSFQSPQEDEFAPLLIALKSLYLGVSFPRREEYYSRYLAFRDVSPDDIEQWKSAYLWFLKKLTWKYGKPLVLKSPPHTARIRLLLELFPEARFVHLVRDPYRVFQSQRHYFDTAMWYTYLQRPDLRSVDDGILRRYTDLYDAYFEDRPRIADERFHEMRFEDLEQDPIGEIKTLYGKLQLPGFAEFEPKLRAYIAARSGYRKNEFPPLEDTWRRRVAKSWSRSFDTWHYPRERERKPEVIHGGR